MKQGKSLQQLAAEIERQVSAKKDYISDTRALSFVPAEDGVKLEVAGNGGPLPILPNAHRQLAERLQIPQRYYDRMLTDAPGLLIDNANHWLQSQPEKRLVRTLDGAVRAFLSDRYQRVDNYDVLNTVLPVLSEVPGVRPVSCEVTDSRLYLKVVSSEIRAEVKSKRVGDIVESGVLITNSEVGLGAVSVKPFALQLVCLNGMVRDKSAFRAAHIGAKTVVGDEVAALLSDEALKADDHAVLLKVRDVLKAAFDAARFREWIDSIQESVARPIVGDVPKVVALAGRELGLLESEQSLVLRHLIAGGDLSQYGLVNAITRTAEDVQSYDRATELEALGPSLIDLSASEWKTIASAGEVKIAA